MSSEPQSPHTGKLLWGIGWVLSVLPCLMLVMSGAMKFSTSPEMEKGFSHLGWSMDVAIALAIVELGSTALYLIPQTAVLGAILLTGYLGGATAAHVRIGEPFYMPIVLGVLLWTGLLLRDRRLWALLPLRRLR